MKIYLCLLFALVAPVWAADLAPETLARLNSMTGSNAVALGSNGVPPGYVLKDDILKPLAKGTYMPKAWPDGIVPFQFDANVTPEWRMAAIKAMDMWSRASNIRVAFVPRNGQADYLHFFDNDANYAVIGHGAGQRSVSIYNWDVLTIVAHEIGHALGLWHEQSRPDRDIYVNIVTNNIDTNNLYNFDMEFSWLAGTTNTPYDYQSAMHYSRCAFSVNPESCDNATGGAGATIVPTGVGDASNMGQRTHLTGSDLTDVLNAYGSGPSRYVDPLGLGFFSFDGGLERPWFSAIVGAGYAGAAGVPGTRLWMQGHHYNETGRMVGAMKILPVPGTGTVRIGP